MPEVRQLVVPYLYIHGSGEDFVYPTSRAQDGPERLAARYLECVLVQAASLRLREVDCDIALATNLTDRSWLGRRGRRLLEEIEAFDVELVFAEYRHRPLAEQALFASSRYVFDAVLAVGEGRAPDTRMWLTDVDCVWLDASRLFAAVPPSPGIGCIHIPYPRDWQIFGFTPQTMGELAQQMGAADASMSWVGGELLSGTVGDLRALVAACELLEQELADGGVTLTTEEQLLSLAGALGRIELGDMSELVQRVWTGPRHGAPTPADAESLCLVHLPSEKGLGFRRAASAITSGHRDRLARDLASPARALRRFNVQGTGRVRRVRDDSWLLAQRTREIARWRLGRS